MAQEPAQETAGDLTARRHQRDEARSQGANAGYKQAGEGKPSVDALKLAQGGEVLLSRLSDFTNANADLRRQVELQTKEVSTLQDAGRDQQDLLRQFQRQAEQLRQAESVAIEAGIRAEIGERETQLRTELDELTEQSRIEREEFMVRMHQMDGEQRHLQGERDEARERVRQLEEKLNDVANAPEAQVARAKGLEMELNLLRTRFARETDAKKAAERASAESRAQQQDLKAHLEREKGQVHQLHKALAEQTELATFRQEISSDLQLKLKDQKTDAENKLRREKGKFEAVARLEGILPRHFLMQALA
jgi:hypothetical protein